MAVHSTPWVQYYRKLADEPGPFFDFDRKDLAYFDDVASSYLEDESRFLLEIARSDGINFIALPDSKGYVKFVHQSFTFSSRPGAKPSAVGLYGSRATSPFRLISSTGSVMPMTIPSTRKKGTVRTIPGIDAFMGVTDTQEFKALSGGSDDPDVSELGKWPVTFWLHPYLYRAVNGVDRIEAAAMGCAVIRTAEELIAGEEGDGEASEPQHFYKLLVFLWAVDKGYTSPVPLSDLPNSVRLDDCCQEVVNRLSAPPAPAPAAAAAVPAGAAQTSGDDDEIKKALLLNLTTMTESTLAAQERDERKKSMRSRLSPEAESLFTLLCARDWRDSKPSLPSFTEKLLADKDLNKALGILRAFTANWKGAVSEKGFAKFLATGYVAPDSPSNSTRPHRPLALCNGHFQSAEK
jgi:hypothetical protein